MVELSRFVVEQIRVCYVSGLYHKADLAVRYSCYFENPLDIIKVLNYGVFEDVREDLRLQIVGINYIMAIKEEYQDAITQEAIIEHDSVLSDDSKASANMQNILRDAGKKLEEKLKIINKEFGTTFTPFDVKTRLKF